MDRRDIHEVLRKMFPNTPQWWVMMDDPKAEKITVRVLMSRC
jgi:hypothetical protein